MKGNLGILDNKPKATLKEAIKLYLEYSENNKKSYKSDITNTRIILKYFGNINLEDITPARIEDFKRDVKQDTGNKNATINRYLQALSKMLNIAVTNDMLSKNPMWSVKKLQENNYKTRVLSDDEEKRLFEEIEKGYEVIGRERTKKIIYPYLHLKNIIICALQTGMRKTEILNLKWLNIDFEYEIIELLITKSGN